MKQFYLVLLSFALTACTSNAKVVDGSFGLPSTVKPTMGMVVTANPLATKAGADILRAGGSAVDAAIAVSAVLSLVEPQSSGLGGGGFMVHFDGENKEVSVYDGRETAPQAIRDTQFLTPEGNSIGYLNAKNSGLSTGVPGMVSMLQLAHEDHGKIAWGPHFDAAKKLATEGFAVSPRLHGMIKRFGKYIPSTKEEGPTDAYRYFFNEQGEPLAVGELRDNPAYAKTLDIIARDPDAFYQGEIAQQIVAQTSMQPRAGVLSLNDIRAYKAQKHSALCSPYQALQLCGPPPPSSWLAVGEIMGLMAAAKEPNAAGNGSVENWIEFAEAQRLAYADRDQYVGDTEFVEVPVMGMLTPKYWQKRVSQAGKALAGGAVEAGDPWEFEKQAKVAYGMDATNDVAGTTHFSIIDGDGNVVSLTASVESIFGSTRMAGGMFLNNQLTDFSFRPEDDNGKPIANRIQAGKRPRSSMSPTIVLDEKGEFLMAAGSPGGNSIIAYTAKTLVAVLEWDLSPQQAIELPNLVARGAKVRIEKGRASDALIEGLKQFGYDVQARSGENSGLGVIYRNEHGELEGGADPRREGTIESIEFK